MRRLALYIDGFNFYHAVNDLRQPHLKWVAIYAVAREIAYSDEKVVVVRYFSAFATWKPGPYARHKAYVTALQASGVECVMAHFKDRHYELPGLRAEVDCA
ncbi:MAG: hypothetical protein L0H73_11595 [Nitrococcus sp.]|nr:hypothetical protein [Nitrococcus sp.]